MLATEARGGLHIVEQSLWAAVPAFLRKLSLALKKHTGRELPIDATPLTFGSWMGGDRDGNPNVTASVSPACCAPHCISLTFAGSKSCAHHSCALYSHQNDISDIEPPKKFAKRLLAEAELWTAIRVTPS